MQILLLSTYDLGKQPFGLASPAAWLRGITDGVNLQDLSRQTLDPDLVRSADIIGIYLPMHTATRLAIRLIPKLKDLNPQAYLACYGLYAPLNEALLRGLGCHSILGGEFETGLLSIAVRLRHDGIGKEDYSHDLEPISLPKQRFLVPDRSKLPPLSRYVRLNASDGLLKEVGTTEASRGCLHSCRHCPVVPVYQGRFRIIQKDVVLDDIGQQVDQGAEHISFGDPDFFNGIGHSMAIVRELHRRYPNVTYDATIKIEHLLEYERHLTTLKETGCLFITSAAESIDDQVLSLLRKEHTREDFIKSTHLLKKIGIVLNPTFVAFTPWTSRKDYQDFLTLLAKLDLVEHVSSIQLGIRLLITAGSPLLDLPDIQSCIQDYEPDSLNYPWKHRDSRMDELCSRIMTVLEHAGARGEDRASTFLQIWDLAFGLGSEMAIDPTPNHVPPRAAIPHLNEPWYC